TFQLRGNQKHAYAHHLFIEQSFQYTKEGGQLFFLVPADLFSSPEAQNLHQLISTQGRLEAVFQLPEALFKNKSAAKALIILRKDTQMTLPKKDVLLAQVPTLSNRKGMELFFEKVRRWK
ncbi:N-6 DNA methylase, partial [Chromobacterium aquaticum]